MPYDHRNTARRTLALALAATGCCAVLAGCGASQASPQSGKAGASQETPPSQEPQGESGTQSRPPLASPSAPRSTRSPVPAQGSRSLAGRTVVIDPGHNSGNFRPFHRNQQEGRYRDDPQGVRHHRHLHERGSYTEASFTLDVSHRLRDLLTARGAKVVLTHDGDRPWGPCIDERARTGNAARADAVVSVHADGSAVGNRGFHVILPAKVRAGSADTARIVAPSRALGERIADRFARATGTSPSNYIGSGTGLDVQDDLGGLNLSTVPEAFVECGNMRDPKDAQLLTSSTWRQKAAQGLADGIAT
ncbi:N-acetylmuramoyl-L-alanine amidase [Streptomyces tanashiensis]